MARPLVSTLLRAQVWGFLSAMTVLPIACRPPALIDPLGRPVPRPILVASIEYGRIVVDSSGEGVRAIVELTRMLPDSTYREEGTVPLLRCPPRESPLPLIRVRTEPVTCHEVRSGTGCDRPGQPNSPCTYVNRPRAHSCSRVVHLEYRLNATPSVGDSVTLQLGDRISRARWTHP